MTTTPTPQPAPESTERLENAIELKEVEGLSQGQIVRARFFRHKGAMIGLAVLIGIIVLAFSSVGVGAVSGWWHYTGNENSAIVNARGAPTLSMPTWLGGDGFSLGEHPLGQDESGADVYLSDIWPSGHEIAQTVETAVQSDMFRKAVFADFTANWQPF